MNYNQYIFIFYIYRYFNILLINRKKCFMLILYEYLKIYNFNDFQFVSFLGLLNLWHG